MKFASKKSQAAYDAAMAAQASASDQVTETKVDTSSEEAKEQQAGDTSDGSADSDQPRFKKPVTVTLPEKSVVKGAYVYTPPVAGKSRWFAVKDVEIEQKDGLIILTGEHKYFAKRGMEVAA